MAKETSFLDQSYCKATLRDHRRYSKLDSGSVFRLNRKYFGSREPRLASISVELVLLEVPSVHFAFERIAEPATFRSPRQNGSRNYELAIGCKRSFLDNGSIYGRSATGAPRRLLFDRTNVSNYGCVVVELSGPESERAGVQADFDFLMKFLETEHHLRGKAIKVNGACLQTSDSLTFDSVFIPDHLRSLIRDNTLSFLAAWDAFKAMGVPAKRGLLLYGPPGTGKTMIAKALANESKGRSSFIWVTSGDIADADDIAGAFRLARKLKPTILFFEDMDFFASERGSGDPKTLGQLLAEMDGLAENDGIVVIGTTNNLRAIEPALAERPSRFDLVLEIGIPTRSARRAILQRLLAKVPNLDLVMDCLLDLTDGMTGAQVQEAAIRSIQHAVLHSTGLPTIDDIRRAAESVSSNDRGEFGFQSGRNNTDDEDDDTADQPVSYSTVSLGADI